MTNLRTGFMATIGNAPIFAVSGILLIVLACNLTKLVPSGDSPANSGTSDRKTTDSTASVATICNNGYYPVGPAVVRKYRVTSPDAAIGSREYTESFTDFAGDTFAVNTDFGAVKAHVTWKCSSDGLLATQYTNTVEMTKSGASARLDTIDSNGITLPPEDRWQTGEKWHAEYHVTETLKGPDGKQMGGGDGIVKQDGEIVGAESVAVPAGSFETMKAQLKTAMDIDVKIKGMSIPMKVPVVESTVYFAKGTGMVKSVTKMGTGVYSTSELISNNK